MKIYYKCYYKRYINSYNYVLIDKLDSNNISLLFWLVCYLLENNEIFFFKSSIIGKERERQEKDSTSTSAAR